MPDSSSEKKYHAFISYRHADNVEHGRQWATWLHQAIELYEVPEDIVGNKNDRGEIIPPRIYPIFRDEEELPANANLGKSIVRALDDTRLLIILCSPKAVASTYVSDEIDYFKRHGHSDRIIAAIIYGEPNASWDKGKQKDGFKKEDECFPEPLRYEYDQEGRRTEKYAEPIAADFRIHNNGRPEQGWTNIGSYRLFLKSSGNFSNREITQKTGSYKKQQHLMLLKIVAGILGIPLSDLTQRDKEYQLEQARSKTKQLRRWLGAVAALALFAVGGGLLAWFQTEKATEQEGIANQQKVIAETERDATLITQSQFLMDQAKQKNDSGASDAAILLALNALPGLYGGDRPAISNLLELRRALSSNKKKAVFRHRDYDDKPNFVQTLLSPSGDVLATISQNNIVLWSIKTGEMLYVLPLGIVTGSVAFTSDSERLLVHNEPDRVYKTPENFSLWSVTAGKKLPAIELDESISGLVLSTDRKRLAYVSRQSGSIKIRSTETGEILQIIKEVSAFTRKFKLGASIKIYNNGFLFDWELSFGSNGDVLASTDGKSITLWSIKTGSRIKTIKTGLDLESFLFVSNQDLLVTISREKLNASNSFVTLWSTKTGKKINTYPNGWFEPVISPDGKMLASITRDPSLYLIDLETGEKIQIADSTDGTYSVAFSPDGELFVTISGEHGDGGGIIWSTKTRERLGRISWGDAALLKAKFTSDSKMIVFEGLQGNEENISLWSLGTREVVAKNMDELVRLAIASLPRNRTCLTPDERSNYSLADLADDQWIARGCLQFTSENR